MEAWTVITDGYGFASDGGRADKAMPSGELPI